MASNTETIESGSSDEMNDVEVAAEEQQAIGDWYVVQTLSGQEMKAQEEANRMKQAENLFRRAMGKMLNASTASCFGTQQRHFLYVSQHVWRFDGSSV